MNGENVRAKAGVAAGTAAAHDAHGRATIEKPGSRAIIGGQDIEGLAEALSRELQLTRVERERMRGAVPRPDVTELAPQPAEVPAEMVPGGFTQSMISGEYARLRAGGALVCVTHPGGHKRRGRIPSRPEVACALGTSPATLKRACDYHGWGTHWPPQGF